MDDWKKLFKSGGGFLAVTVAQYLIGKILDCFHIVFPILTTNISDIILYIGLIVGISLMIYGIWIFNKNRYSIYDSRKYLENLDKMLPQAKYDVCFLGVSLQKIILQHAEIVKKLLHNGLTLEFLFLNPTLY